MSPEPSPPVLPVQQRALSGYAAAGLATLFWGLSFVALRIALDELTPGGVVWVRNLIGASFLFAVVGLRGGRLLPRGEDLPRSLGLGLLLGVHQLAQSLALGATTAVRAGWTIAFIPAVVALLGALFLGRALRPLGWLGIATASGGVIVLNSARPTELAQAGWGDLVMLGTCFSWAAYTLLALGPASRSGPLRVSAVSTAVATLPALAVALVSGTWHAPPSPHGIAAAVFLGLLASACALWAYSHAIAALGPERASSFQYLQPLVTLAGSLALLGEPLSRGALLGGPLVLLGVFLVQRGRPRPSAASSPSAACAASSPEPECAPFPQGPPDCEPTTRS